MSELEVRPMGPVIGAEIHGVDLGSKLSKTTFDQIEKALLDHLVIVFRGQDITPEQHLEFGRHFGEVYCPAMSAFPPEHPEIMLLDTTTPKGAGADNWHTDATFRNSVTPPFLMASNCIYWIPPYSTRLWHSIRSIWFSPDAIGTLVASAISPHDQSGL